jgi:hypothetical protein
MALKSNLEGFLKKYKEKFPDSKYDFSQSVYINNKTNMKVMCPIHGEFYARPDNLLHNHGCKQCGFDKEKDKNKDWRINKVKKYISSIGKKWEILKIEFKDGKYRLYACCHEKDEFGNEHGNFDISINDLLQGHGCRKCSGIMVTNQKEFIERSNLIYNGKYDYSEVNYTDSHTKVKILCKDKLVYTNLNDLFSKIEETKKEKNIL